MRFTEDGPDIPNELLRQWRQGKVLFLAGAGVSVPAKLPLFRELAVDTYNDMNDPVGTVAKKILKRKKVSEAAKHKLIDAASLSFKQQVEVELILSNQLDRLFAAMESRLDHDEGGRSHSRKVRSSVEKVLRKSVSSTQEHADLLRLSMPPMATQARKEKCRIATTNFDRLFEHAWAKEFMDDPVWYDARLAPRPGSHSFQGIIHLHGALNDNPAVPAEFVLSSRDFARVYLRSGVIANYVYDLIRRYIVVLVGYSADDPPMRYLMDAIAEDVSLFEDMSFPYAIVDWDSANARDVKGAMTVERWRTKNIRPILFPRSVGSKAFEPLWKTLNVWAEWARRDTNWIDDELASKASVTYGQASPFAQAFVRDLLSILDADEMMRAISGMKKAGASFDWIEAVDAAAREEGSP